MRDFEIRANAMVLRSKENSYSMILERLGQVFEQSDAWLDKPHEQFNGRTPRGLIESGPVEAWDVELAADQLASLHGEIAQLTEVMERMQARLKEASEQFRELQNAVPAANKH